MLIVICASLLGIIDEIMQGIHPMRAFGLRDMVVNSASSFIGALTIVGLRKEADENWDWMKRIEISYRFLLLSIGGLAGTVLMIIFLLDVRDQTGFNKNYPFSTGHSNNNFASPSIGKHENYRLGFCDRFLPELQFGVTFCFIHGRCEHTVFGPGPDNVIKSGPEPCPQSG